MFSGSGLVRRATVQVVWGDVIARFVAAALRSKPTHICLVSPWLSENDDAQVSVLLTHARRNRAEVTLVTRPMAVAPESLAALVDRQHGARVLISNHLHAKLYVCQEGDGRGVAMIGSANLTAGAVRLAEIGLLVRPLVGSRIIDDLARVATTQLGAREYTVGARVRRSA